MRIITALLAIALSVMPLKGDERPSLEHLLSSGFSYRNLGPFRAGSWVSDIAVPDAPSKTTCTPSTLAVATAEFGRPQTTEQHSRTSSMVTQSLRSDHWL